MSRPAGPRDVSAASLQTTNDLRRRHHLSGKRGTISLRKSALRHTALTHAAIAKSFTGAAERPEPPQEEQGQQQEQHQQGDEENGAVKLESKHMLHEHHCYCTEKTFPHCWPGMKLHPASR